MKRIVFFISVIVYIVCYPNVQKRQIELCNTNDTLKVVKEVYTDFIDGKPQPEEVWTFFYESDLISRIESISDGKITGNVEIKYEDGKLKEMKEYSKPLKSENELSVLRIFNYDKDLIVSVLLIEDQRKTSKVYKYNDLKQVVRCQDIEDGKQVSEEIFFYNINGNVSKKIYKDSFSTYKTFYKSYDDKNHPFGLIYSEAYLKVVSICRNNILYSYNTEDVSEKYEYEYNSKNYLTKIIMKINDKIPNITTIEYK